MKSSTEQAGFQSGDRHGWLDEMCTILERIIHGRNAQAWLDGTYGPLPTRGAIVALPAWMWIDPGDVVGRKSRAADGGRLKLPVRVSWQPTPLVVLATGTTEQVDWVAIGVAHSGNGRTEVTVGPASLMQQAPVDANTTHPPAVLEAASVSKSKIRAGLRRLVEDGKAANWDAMVRLEPYVDQACRTAVGAVAYEIADEHTSDDPRPVLDETSMESLRNRMMYGENSEHPGSVSLLIERCLSPGSFRKVDPMRYIRIRLNQEARQHVQLMIGDPRIGPTIRREWRQSDPSSPQEFLDLYRERHPNDRLAMTRACQALTVGAVASAGATSTDVLHEHPHSGHGLDTISSVEDRMDFSTDMAEVVADPEIRKRLDAVKNTVVRRAQRTIDRAVEKAVEKADAAAETSADANIDRATHQRILQAARIVTGDILLEDIAEPYLTKWPDDELSHLLRTIPEGSHSEGAP